MGEGLGCQFSIKGLLLKGYPMFFLKYYCRAVISFLASEGGEYSSEGDYFKYLLTGSRALNMLFYHPTINKNNYHIK